MEISLQADKDLDIRQDNVLGNNRLIITSHGKYGKEWRIYIDNIDIIKEDLIEELNKIGAE